MQKMRISDWAVLSVLSLVACTEQLPITGSSRDVVTTPVMPANSVQPVTINVCSNATTAAAGGWSTFTDGKNGAWAAPVGASVWIGPTGYVSPDGIARQSDKDYARKGVTTFNATFTLPSGATGVSLSGNLGADNDVVVQLNGGQIFTTTPGPYPANVADFSTAPDFQTVGGLAFGAGAGFVTGGNTVAFTVYNDDYPNFGNPNASNENHAPTGNPLGLDFCFTVSYTPFVPPPVVALFVIGDVEAHALGDNVNFWGAQWWKNNQMSGVVSNGVASFKGYATSSDNVCGGNWVSLPGNSSNPPETIPADVAVIVTSKVLKSGPNISGDIVQIVLVHHDGNYQDNPGHAGNGPVTSIICGGAP